MRQTTGEFTVVGAWPKGITVGSWREGGCAAHSLIQLIEIYGRKVVSMKRIDRNNTFVCLLALPKMTNGTQSENYM